MTVRVAGPPLVQSLPVFDRALLEARAQTLLQELGHQKSELSISLVGDDEMAELNGRFRAEAAPTDVLSFSLLEGEHAAFHGDLLGEVVISADTARREAAARGHPAYDEVLLYAVHGVMHLVGHDDHDPADHMIQKSVANNLKNQYFSLFLPGNPVDISYCTASRLMRISQGCKIVTAY